MIPTQWIETDKKAHLKRPGQEHLHEPELKSRLVACGHLEDAKDAIKDGSTTYLCREIISRISLRALVLSPSRQTNKAV